jgi:quercetin dioxygenase-like cupin family protein
MPGRLRVLLPSRRSKARLTARRRSQLCRAALPAGWDSQRCSSSASHHAFTCRSFPGQRRDTGGALSIVEHPFPVGALVPPHTHAREDEYSIVIEGEIGFWSGDREVVLGPGGYISKPCGELHTMWNGGAAPARMIEVISPAGFENFFRELADLTAAGPPQPPDMMALARRYGLQFGQPDWLPDLITR